MCNEKFRLYLSVPPFFLDRFVLTKFLNLTYGNEIQVPFQQLLTIVRMLTPSQKARLSAELNEEKVETKQQDDFIEYLLKGPVYNDKDLQIIEENRKSITAFLQPFKIFAAGKLLKGGRHQCLWHG